jgi:phage terminase large subunit GpA-like protein
VRGADELDRAWKAAIEDLQIFGSPVRWAMARRTLGPDETARPGPYRPEPYLVEPMDAASFSDACEVLVLLAGSQVAKTTAVQCIWGHMVVEEPGPSLWVVPTEELIQTTRANKIDPFVRNTPALSARVGKTNVRKKRADNAVMVGYDGGVLKLAASRGTTTYAQDPAKLVILDDVDKFGMRPKDGAHVNLALSRIGTYREQNSKVLVVSKPALFTESETVAAYKSSSRAVYEVPCPHCGHYFVLWRDRFRYKDDMSPHFECPECTRQIFEHSRDRMVEKGRWHHRAPTRAAIRKGYHFWAAYAPRRYRGWDAMAEALRSAERQLGTGKDTEMQSALGEDWAWAWTPDSESKLDEQEERVYRRREEPFAGRLRLREGCITTASTDVQGNRIETAIWKWAPGLEQWIWLHVVTKSPPELPSTWLAWAEILAFHKVQSATVDAKWKEKVVIDGIMPHLPELFALKCAVYATQGIETAGPIWPGAVEPGNPVNQRAAPVKIRVNTAKAAIYGWLEHVMGPGPGFIHLDTKVHRKLLKQLYSERRVTGSGRKTRYEPRPGRIRNELLDLAVGNLAALEAYCHLFPAAHQFISGGSGKTWLVGPEDSDQGG